MDMYQAAALEKVYWSLLGKNNKKKETQLFLFKAPYLYQKIYPKDIYSALCQKYSEDDFEAKFNLFTEKARRMRFLVKSKISSI
jgi:hypothetical protein